MPLGAWHYAPTTREKSTRVFDIDFEFARSLYRVRMAKLAFAAANRGASSMGKKYAFLMLFAHIHRNHLRYPGGSISRAVQIDRAVRISTGRK